MRRVFRLNNPEIVKTRNKVYFKSPKGKEAIRRGNYKRRGCINGYHTLAEWELVLKQFNFTCPMCHRSEPEVKLTQDHIIPVSKGGSNNIENIQPLCKSCNSKKYLKIISFKENIK